MKQKNKKTKSIIIIIYAIMIVVIFTIFGIIFVNNKYTKSITYDCITDKGELYKKVLEREITSINQELQMLRISQNDLFRKMPFKASPADGEYYSIWNEFKQINTDKGALFNNKCQFFEYEYNSDVLIIGKAIRFKTSKRTEYTNEIVKRLRDNCESDVETVKWDLFSSNEVDCLMGSIQSEGKVIGCIFKISALIRDFEIDSLGYEGFLLFEKNQKYYSSQDTKKQKEIKYIISEIKEKNNDNGITDACAWYSYKLNGVGKLIIVTVLSHGIIDTVNILQLLLSLALGAIVLIVLYMIYYLYKKVLMPMKNFVVQLQNSEEDIYLHEKNGEGPIELIYASDKFKQIYNELQRLRIDLYEKELYEKTTMLEYAQEQLKPHFFLNCMSVVQSMAELHNEEDIVHILDVLSTYMRYVLKDTFEMRYIKDELKHLNDYMEIQALSKPGMFKYEAVVEDDLGEHEILPLVLQTIVENSVKHGLKAGECIEISIYITSIEIKEEKYLYIVISDTGNGFPREVLEKIKNEEPIIYNGCEHIGIKNTINRIKMKYGEKATVTFGNIKEGFGAVVEITLPLE